MAKVFLTVALLVTAILPHDHGHPHYHEPEREKRPRAVRVVVHAT